MKKRLYKYLENLFRPYYLKAINIESREGHWEIWNLDENKQNETITIHYVPKDGYSDADIKIEVPHDHFNELINFLENVR